MREGHDALKGAATACVIVLGAASITALGFMGLNAYTVRQRATETYCYEALSTFYSSMPALIDSIMSDGVLTVGECRSIFDENTRLDELRTVQHNRELVTKYQKLKGAE